MVLAFDHFKAYLLNTQKSVIVFTDARALMWVGRNREYSIACNGLVNKLAKIQLEIPHVVYSVPSEVNYLADIFSRAFTTSRFLDKSKFALSKAQANKLPPVNVAGAWKGASERKTHAAHLWGWFSGSQLCTGLLKVGNGRRFSGLPPPSREDKGGTQVQDLHTQNGAHGVASGGPVVPEDQGLPTHGN